MSQRILRRLEIDAGHRLLKHEGKCANYHGHRYVFDIHIEAAKLDDVGRVVDFSVVKGVVGKWLDDVFDHGMILEHGDPLIPALIEQRVKLVVLDSPPTAEHIAQVVYETARSQLASHGVDVVQVDCWETPNCRASYP